MQITAVYALHDANYPPNYVHSNAAAAADQHF